MVMVGGRDHGPGGVCQSVGGGGGGWGGARGQGRAGDRRRRDATRGSGLLDRVLGVPSWALTLAAAARRFVPPSGQLIEAEEKRHGGSKFQCIWVLGTSFVLQYIRGCVGGNSDLGCACLPLLREAWWHVAVCSSSDFARYFVQIGGGRGKASTLASRLLHLHLLLPD